LEGVIVQNGESAFSKLDHELVAQRVKPARRLAKNSGTGVSPVTRATEKTGETPIPLCCALLLVLAATDRWRRHPVIR
jgi:hypothetical protein